MADQTQDPAPGGALLVPVGESVTLRNTVAHAVATAAEDGLEEVHFVAPVAQHFVGDADRPAREAVRALLERVSVWADEDAPEAAPTVRTAVIGTDEYLFSPDDYAAVLSAYAAEHGIERIVVDPEYSPGGNVPLLRPMEVALAKRGLDVSEAPASRPVRRSRLSRRGGALQFGLLFGVSFLFYHLLGGFAVVTGDSFDFYYELATSTLVAGIVAGSLYTVSLSAQTRVRTLVAQAIRLVVYVPYLLYEIVKSNVLITLIILHPKLPIEPRMTRVRSAVWGGPALTTLANSITLTPGTLTVRADGQRLYVHGLFASARDGVAEGDLERAVRFVFYGRRAAAISSPEERGDYEELQGPEAAAEAAEATGTTETGGNSA
ncbi:Mrp-type sodium/proton antiporter system subunit E [Natronomonas moolapensis 8.8.11]|uniref:Mrp-type sodium/proton antiporter system subunit E n=1 Tax=Natronomonas moolapensis (strain DSM 18674 / CECT 7526 / JCM 14361 / 8.8.11) TaxID=268739 RepID=M1XNV4_NATM8|nr:monovalent cation/H+ antiporter subunit E [Natronomonas moolapensis]CCQ35653.1 Mrp-type sodium/proton antiporter system subunit E [Natronomonas moolapensis 8.8.11]